MSSIWVGINSAEERCSHFFSRSPNEMASSSRMVVEECGYVVYKPSYQDERSRFRFLLDYQNKKHGLALGFFFFLKSITRRKNWQVSHVTTGKLSIDVGHFIESWSCFNSFNFIANWPLEISLLGNTRKWLARPILPQSAMNHLVGSYWYQRKAFR